MTAMNNSQPDEPHQVTGRDQIAPSVLRASDEESERTGMLGDRLDRGVSEDTRFIEQEKRS